MVFDKQGKRRYPCIDSRGGGQPTALAERNDPHQDPVSTYPGDERAARVPLARVGLATDLKGAQVDAGIHNYFNKPLHVELAYVDIRHLKISLPQLSGCRQTTPKPPPANHTHGMKKIVANLPRI
ncbi:hypothetical protein DSO57_1023032 [Entomophthora muscae]|uniref:Uncharacterized protein n=1 Tax=Entomophthora muscae TaxID=34485 RepID=A0ACC2UCH3_9FUNG|nr:hypothetical protein DSO57_1023032 [Entomophthora muscae]